MGRLIFLCSVTINLCVDLKAFELRLTECVAATLANTRKWRCKISWKFLIEQTLIGVHQLEYSRVLNSLVNLDPIRMGSGQLSLTESAAVPTFQCYCVIYSNIPNRGQGSLGYSYWEVKPAKLYWG